MAESETIEGIARNVRTHTNVSGGGNNHVRSFEVLTLDVEVQEENQRRMISVELVGGSAFKNNGMIRSVPADGDKVRVTGTWKHGESFLRARDISNLSTGVSTSGRRWAL